MNYVLINDKSNFEEVLNCTLLITGDENRMHDEIFENMWAITLTEQMAKAIDSKYLMNFIETLIETRKKQLSGKPATFYLWLDDVIGQLRFNVLSTHRRPPFECTLNLLDSPQEILKKFLKSNRGEIPWGELEVIEGDFDDDDEHNDYVQSVYVKYL